MIRAPTSAVERASRHVDFCKRRSPACRSKARRCLVRPFGRSIEPCHRLEGFPKLTDPPDQDNTVDAILAKSPPLSLDIPEGTSFEHWLALGKHLALVDNTLAWRIGDWWVYGEHRYGDRVAAIRTRRWNGPSFGACRNYAMVARAFETSRRRDTLSFSHHREVASLSPQDADRLLDWAEQPLRNDGRPRLHSSHRDRGIRYCDLQRPCIVRPKARTGGRRPA